MELIEALQVWCREQLKEMVLPVKRKYAQDGEIERAIDVYIYGMRDPSEEPCIPYMLLQHLKGQDGFNRETRKWENECQIRFVITIYEKDETEGMKALENIIMRLRLQLWKKTLFCGKYELKGLEYLMIPDNSEKYYLGEIMTTWSTPGIQRDVPGLHGW